MNRRVVVLGAGNPLRGDDGAGPAAVRDLRGEVLAATVLAVCDGDPARMLELWRGADALVVVEAVLLRPARPGHLHTFSAAEAMCGAAGAACTYALGLGACLASAEALGKLPPDVVVNAVEVEGAGLGRSSARRCGRRCRS
ncbi:hydrogenase maturation protease [Streptomyces solincola]|uniref:hydrogenase maturation protease n=1 Tax=Streptomyces solincola TaxID=2100817 RepID=UPI002158B73E|nr:hydrogenase maturation protease [Streptomyces solincola]